MTEKRRAIIDSANRIFYRDGFAEVGVDRVVQEADVALGTLYRHFRSRSEMIVAAMAERHGRFLHDLERRTAGASGPDAVLGLVDALGAWSTAEGGNGCFFLRAAADYPHDAAIRAAALDHKRQYLELIERRLRDGGWSAGRAVELAATVFVLMEGAVAAAFTLGDRTAIATARSLVARVLSEAATPS